MLSQALFACMLYASSAVAAPAAAPVVTLDSGTFVGTTDGISQSFLGIPFAQPPVGDLRYRLPQTILPYNGSYSATSYGPSCTQQALDLPIVTGLAAEAADFITNSALRAVFPDSEDCLTVNVIKPATAIATSKLPVLVWIYGGGFEIGGTSMYNGGLIVSRSIVMGEPVIYVSMNYRLAGFGFLSGKEVKEARIGNLGLQDQREALRWVQKYIAQFGGDPTKVTIWGESAGAISVSLHMLVNGGDTEGLFRAGFMESGAPIPVGDMTNGQKYYDFLVSDTGCSGATDTLACLRTVPYANLKAAINKTPGLLSYQGLNLVWFPRTDGVFLTDNPQNLVQQGTVANVPFVTGNCDDEGTLFSLSSLNLTTDAEFMNYIEAVFFPGTADNQINQIAAAYPSDITQGSPFDTGDLNAITPQFKRIAAFQGDAVFQAPRRWLLQNTLPTNPNVWAFVSKRLKTLPVLGSVHTSDLLGSYGGGHLQDYLIQFTNTLNPNSDSLLNFQWPKYDLQTRPLLTFMDGLVARTITADTYRQSAMDLLTTIALTNPF